MTSPIQAYFIGADRPPASGDLRTGRPPAKPDAGRRSPGPPQGRERRRDARAQHRRARPRRTIRIALWAGEEQGLLGSRAWVKQHLEGEANAAARDRFSVYFNIDNGFPPATGFYMEGNEPAQRIVAAWLKPLADLGATETVSGGIGATDHLAFTALKLPGFQAVQS